jgi:hypothetical protein
MHLLPWTSHPETLIPERPLSKLPLPILITLLVAAVGGFIDIAISQVPS